MQTPVALLATLETAINQYLRLDPDTLHRLQSLEGRVIALHLQGVELILYCLPGGQGLQLMGHYEGEPDATISGTPFAMLRMGLSTHAEKMLFSGEVTITGDNHLGQQFKEILDHMEVDWEEHLSHIIGDVAAHQLGRLFRSAARWGQQTLDTLTLDASEYLQEEARLVATAPELEQFYHEVDHLRSDADRLAARVQRLHDNLSTHAEFTKDSQVQPGSHS